MQRSGRFARREPAGQDRQCEDRIVRYDRVILDEMPLAKLRAAVARGDELVAQGLVADDDVLLCAARNLLAEREGAGRAGTLESSQR